MIQGAVDDRAGQGNQYAIPMSINVKSIVFYPKKAAQAAGLTTPPQTFDDLQTLSTTASRPPAPRPGASASSPGAATGWPATDWVENLMLINYGSDVYNQWVNHEIPFNDPKVLDVLNQMDALLLGRRADQRRPASRSPATTSTPPANPMFDNPPGCYMYRQGNFVAKQGGFPDAVLADLDNTVGVFPMPGKTAADKPVLGGGDLAGIFSKNNDSAKKLVQFLASKDYGTNGYAETGAWISPRTDFDTSLYPSETLRRHRQDRLQLDGVRLRRLRPDAGRGRLGFVLAGDDRLDQRPGGRQDGAGQHREQLAAADCIGRGAGRPVRPAPRHPSVFPPAADGRAPVVIKILNALIAVVGGVVGAIVLYYLLNKLAELLPGRWEDRVKPYLYLLPALAAITLYLIYPTIQTFVYSFANAPSTAVRRLRATTPSC